MNTTKKTNLGTRLIKKVIKCNLGIILFFYLNCTFLLGQTPGSLDRKYGIQGIQTFSLSGSNNDNFITALDIQKDNKVIATGSYTTSSGLKVFSVARFDELGNLDNTFSSDGFDLLTIGATSNTPTSILAYPSNKTVVGGYSINSSGNQHISIARYNDNGVLDTDFSTDGKLFEKIVSDEEYLYGMAFQNVGNTYKIIGCGMYKSGTKFYGLIFRLNDDGSLDKTFNTSGYLTTDLGFTGCSFYSVTVNSDNEILICGTVNSSNASDICVLKLNTNGTFANQTNFGKNGNGYTIFDSGGDDVAKDIVLNNDSIFLGGYSNNNGKYELLIIKFKKNGFIDDKFASGKGYKLIGAGVSCNGEAISVQKNGKIIIAGSLVRSTANNDRDFIIARCNIDGAIDNSFNGSGIVTTSISNNDNLFTDMVLESNGKIVLGGGSGNGQHLQYALARYFGDTILFPSSINQLSHTNKTIQLFPNPAFSYITLKNFSSSEISSIEIFDALGRKQEITLNNSETIKLENLNPGLYFVNCTNKMGCVFVGKFYKE